MDQTTKKIHSLCSVSTRMTAQTFFPERFYMPFAEKVHGEIFKLLDGPDNKIAIAAPRGWGKTSIVALALMARYVMYSLTGFICYINKSHDAASLQTENLRRELVTNRMIKHFFGNFKHRNANNNDFDEVFSKKAWVAYDTLVWPRGAGQQVRGVLFKNDRPGLIIIDDLEDPEQVTNEEYRRKQFEWLYADVVKAVPRIGEGARNYKIVYIDTLKHEDALIQKLLDSPEWKSIRLEACDDNFQSSAPEFMSNEDIQREWKEHLDSGQSDVFFRELRNLPISTKDSAFRKEYFHYYNVGDTSRDDQDLNLMDTEIQNDQSIETVILVDPAKTVKIHSAESAVLGIGIDLRNARIYLRDGVSEKMYPDEIYDTMFNMAMNLNAKVIGVEDTGLSEFIRQPIKNEMFKRAAGKKGAFYELIWLKARGGSNGEKGKSLRVKELVPYYRQGYIFHNKLSAITAKLEQQLLMFPRSRLWDVMDCFAYIIEMLELGERYFNPQDGIEDIEAEYDELEYEKSIEDWETV